QEAVADVHGLLDVLQAYGLVGDARDRERARNRTGGDHDDVVLELVRLADRRLDGGDLARVVDVGDLRGDDVGRLQVTTVGDDRVTRLDRPDGDLRKEGLVRHVRQRVDHGDLGL